MSMLYPGALPEAVEVDGSVFAIRPQYYIALEIMRILGDPSLDRGIGLAASLDLFYVDAIPTDIENAAAAMFEFITRGSWDNGYKGKATKVRILDWEIDAPFIWASMKQAYPFWDWSQAHWWEFKAAFDSLPSDSKIKEVMSIRQRTESKDMSADQKKALKEVKAAYALAAGGSGRRTAKEIEAELENGVK